MTDEQGHVPTDADLDALLLLIRNAERGGCGSHQGCRDLVAKKKRDAARRWFIGADLRLPPGHPVHLPTAEDQGDGSGVGA